MKLIVKHQEHYSRGELLLRTLFGFLYIALPHFFILMFVGLFGAILRFIAFWVVLFTGRYPQSMFEFQVNLMKWSVRIMARLWNLSDGYPAFGLKATDEHTDLTVPYPEKISRGLVLLRLFFGIFYVYIPHGFLLAFRGFWVGILIFLSWWVGILIFLSWWVVLFTAKYPASFHEWAVGLIRWQMRLNLYMGYMTDTYPPFTGDEKPDEV